MKSKLLGFVIVIIGILFLGNSLELWNANLFFEGWWTLFIIVPSLISILKREWFSGTLGLSIGMFLLLAANDIVDWSLIGPLFIIFVGLAIVLAEKPKDFKVAKSEYLAIFSGSENKIVGEFKGTEATTIFGGIDLDLRKAVIKSDVVIKCSCLFGGIDILVPENVKVTVKGTPIFGGIENSCENNDGNTITIDCLCVFGGISVK